MNAIESAFAPLRDLPCWNVKPGYGSFLTMEFGRPSLSIREPMAAPTARTARVRKLLSRRTITVHGEWHLWIYCCAWEVTDGGKPAGDWTTPRRRKKAALELDGQKLVDVFVNRRRGRSEFRFEFGSRLTTRPYDRDSEQWMFAEPNGDWLSFRADGLYRHGPGNRTPEQVWQQV